MDTFTTLVLKTASKDKAITVLNDSYAISRMVKQAKLDYIKQMFRDKALNKTAEEKPFMDRMSAWWSDDANKAGVAGAGIAGLLGYGLMPGKNKIMKLLGALGLGTAGYFGGQALWPTVKDWFGTAKDTPAAPTGGADNPPAPDTQPKQTTQTGTRNKARKQLPWSPKAQ